MNSKKAKSTKNILDDRRVTFISALLLGLLAWVIVAGFIMPNTESRVRNIPIDYVEDEQTYLDRGLQIVGVPAENNAEVFLRGDGSQLGGLEPEDFHIWVDYTQVTGPGLQEVPIEVTRLSSASFEVADFSVIGNGYSLDDRVKSTVTLTFERLATQSFDIVGKADGVTASAGYFRDSVVVNPVSVSIRGPASRVEQVSQVAAEVTAAGVLVESTRYQGVRLTLLDAQGAALNPEEMDLTLSVTSADVSVIVNEVRKIGLTTTFVGLPANFDSEWFYERIHLSVEELEVVGSTAAFENLANPYPVAEFDISQLGLRWESGPINIVMPQDSGLRINDQLRYVSVLFDDTGITEKTFEVPRSSIRVMGSPVNATISPISDSMTVKLVGPEDQIDKLLTENISIQVVASGVSAAVAGTQISLPARVRIPAADRCFAVGNYSLICDVVAN